MVGYRGRQLRADRAWREVNFSTVSVNALRLAKETFRRLMTDAGLWVPRRQHPPKVYQPRARRACPGERARQLGGFVLIDSTPDGQRRPPAAAIKYPA
ncbi:hypothetical protein LMG28614_02995 [Paraburkholderia ultramafica]|uniref:Uncharacterized protein n=1 Tax=Paraburkholderia ultramafica TaxID=1544867 RepID=A0A6S7CWR6_9BURK|nr:hypothetical protein LMG28614_02995 [Paraburkholderia ultramafica]